MAWRGHGNLSGNDNLCISSRYASMHLPIYQSSCHRGQSQLCSGSVDQICFPFKVAKLAKLGWGRPSWPAWLRDVQDVSKACVWIGRSGLGSCTYRLRIDNLPVVKQGTAEPQGRDAEISHVRARDVFPTPRRLDWCGSRFVIRGRQRERNLTKLQREAQATKACTALLRHKRDTDATGIGTCTCQWMRYRCKPPAQKKNKPTNKFALPLPL